MPSPDRCEEEDRSAPVRVGGASFVIESSGFGDGPAQALRDFLIQRGAGIVTTIAHPLTPEHPSVHVVERYLADGSVHRREIRSLNQPPYTFALDPFYPILPPTADGWFGFNCIATARGLAFRRLGRVGRVVHWSVDFVPERFTQAVIDRSYQAMDRFCCRHADARVDLSDAALQGRNEKHRLMPDASAPAVVVPMGAWLGRTPTASWTTAADRRVVFMGHLVGRMGAGELISALGLLTKAGEPFVADIVGGGPLESHLRREVTRLNLDGRVTMHGFVPDHREVEAILARGTVAIAPYVDDPESFTRFADPGKLKAYLGAGLPIVVTPVPPNAAELVAHAGAVEVVGSVDSIADGIRLVLNEGEQSWTARHQLARAYGSRFDWNEILGEALPALGFPLG